MTFDRSAFDTSLLILAGLTGVATNRLSEFLSLPTRAPHLSQWRRTLSLTGLGLAAVEYGFHIRWSHFDQVYLGGVLLALGVALYSLRTYRPARTLLVAGAPLAAYVIGNLVTELVAPGFAARYEDQLDTVQLGALLWLLGFIYVARREKRTLAAEELLRAEEARARAEAEARKLELEQTVSERTAALRQQTTELEQTLRELRATQTQLIQSEKMASLGELTAGIAHEIQNPLNFVNNFADVSRELLDELKAAQAAGDPEEVTALVGDLTQNLTKISEHGKRASSIVRGMLEHSRASTGERTPTDLNALADEYLRLAYHGLRAKDKTFNAQLETDFDVALPPAHVAASDVGRVLLNLFTNAFYAVRQRQQHSQQKGESVGATPYQPTVRVRTRALPGGGAEIRVRDNGTGVPDAVKTKIFQPFFTTKPTGEGTGLGLSLSFDIITKGHGGTLAVESQEGVGTEFIITLRG